ncbi:MAG: Stk1 family PASTA domain-containing Ser/Thr kinase [Tissierellia bacterium]|nr:Stk1 family PASTA domain-containing Ser/Thr kinase [Tissierellia bacterium]
MIESLLGNRYEILERIGGGGMADVYKAHDKKLDRIVALKILKQDFVNDVEFVEKFKRESHSAAKLTHPNIVNVFDVGFEDEDHKTVYYIVMEYINGKTLKDLIRETGGLTVEKAVNYVIQIAEALSKAHENDIVHRDIKPQNIMVTNDEQMKVTDFGIAKAANNATVTAGNDILGSVHYFSPEQARGNATDVRSDIYSLGIVFFEMLTGQVPFDSDSPISIALKQVQENIVKPSTLNRAIPVDVDRIVLKMTEKNPQMRYNDMGELLEDLNKLNSSSHTETVSDDTVYMNAVPVGDINEKTNNRSTRNRHVYTTGGGKDRIENRPRKKKSSIGKSILGIILGIVLAFGIATAGFYVLTTMMSTSGTNSNEVKVPKLVSLTQEEAESKLDELGLKYEINMVRNEKFEPGQVVSQNASPGTNVKKNFVLKLDVNSSPDLIEVPSVVDKELKDAEHELALAGFFPKVSYMELEKDSDLNVGVVVEQDPQALSAAKEGSVVNIVVTKAYGEDIEDNLDDTEEDENPTDTEETDDNTDDEKSDKLVTMPSLLGLSLDSAKDVINRLGLKVGKISEDYTDMYDKNDIMRQEYTSGAEVKKGTRVDLTVVIGNMADKKKAGLDDGKPEENKPTDNEDQNDDKKPDKKPEEEKPKEPIETPKPSLKETKFTILLPEDKDQVLIKVLRTQDGSSETVYEKSVNTSDKTTTISVKGKAGAVFEVYVDGVLAQSFQQ